MIVFLFAVDRSGSGQSGNSPRVTLRLNQVRSARDEKKGTASNSRQGTMSAQVKRRKDKKNIYSKSRIYYVSDKLYYCSCIFFDRKILGAIERAKENINC